jgi:hypothetical protein
MSSGQNSYQWSFGEAELAGRTRTATEPKHANQAGPLI